MKSAEKLLSVLQHKFKQPHLLNEALTHSSISSARIDSYERLEFLGDRVLGLVVAEMLICRFPGEAEGDLAKRHAVLVSRDSLVTVASDMGIDMAMRLSRGESDGGGRSKPTLLADVTEAVIGAMYLDAGLEKTAILIQRFWTPLMEQNVTPPKDPKTALQEWSQGRGLSLPTYSLVRKEGADHEPIFYVEVAVTDDKKAVGSGSSKRIAERDAAARLLEGLPS